ncbi:MAG: hypothetical protein J6U06_10535, partial [Spirochaetaceae bacterium]|nr:hypothetical protein [Spirochaetaceae bacterium]
MFTAAFKEAGEPFSISEIRYASCGEPAFDAGAAQSLKNEKTSNIKVQNLKVQQRCLLFIRKYPRNRHQNLHRSQVRPF